MSDALGYSLVIIFLTLIGVFTLVKFYLNRFHEGRLQVLNFIFSLILALLPAFFLFAIGLSWRFNESYLPSGDSNDLTYSSFHITFLLLTLLFTIILVVRAPRDQKSEKRYMFGRFDAVDNTVFFIGVMLVGIELFKQIYYLTLNEGLAHYQWYGFPLQFCSVAMFLYPLTPFVKNAKIKNALYAFIGIFTAVGGLSVMIVGQSIFTLSVAISIHTMLWHGSMVVVSIYVLVARKIGKSFKDYVSAIIVLIGFILLAQAVNVLFHFLSPLHPGLAEFDGFFINPWKSNQNMPILSNIRIDLQNSGMHVSLVGIIFSVLYLLAFSAGGVVIFIGLRLPYIIKKALSKKDDEQKVQVQN